MSVTTISEIPVIDISPSYLPSPEARRGVADRIREACRDTGFFYVSGHGVPDRVIEATLTTGKAFFAEPLEEKMKLFGPGAGYGYDPSEVQVLDSGTPPDLKEGFMIGMPSNAFARKVSFPDDLPALEETMKIYQAHMISLGRHLMRCIALSLDLAEDYFDEGFSAPDCAVRLLHYAPKPATAPPDQIGAGAHTDWGAITMLWQDEVGGLEVQDASGNWISATPVPGTFVINLADMIRRWTNDEYRSTLHRVVNRPGETRDRYSIATFFNPYDAYEVRCVPSCMPARGEPNYAPCTVGEHIRLKAEESYGMAS